MSPATNRTQASCSPSRKWASRLSRSILAIRSVEPVSRACSMARISSGRLSERLPNSTSVKEATSLGRRADRSTSPSPASRRPSGRLPRPQG